MVTDESAADATVTPIAAASGYLEVTSPADTTTVSPIPEASAGLQTAIEVDGFSPNGFATWDDLVAGFATWADVVAAFPSWDAITSATSGSVIRGRKIARLGVAEESDESFALGSTIKLGSASQTVSPASIASGFVSKASTAIAVVQPIATSLGGLLRTGTASALVSVSSSASGVTIRVPYVGPPGEEPLVPINPQSPFNPLVLTGNGRSANVKSAFR